jgi:hypothetical protein
LSLDERLVIEWAANRLTPDDERRLRKMFDVLLRESEPWAVVLEHPDGEASVVKAAERGEVVDVIDGLFKAPRGWGLAVVLPAQEPGVDGEREPTRSTRRDLTGTSTPLRDDSF